MSEFWTSQDFISWKHCYCGEGCISNCVGMPTFKGIILFLSIIILICFFTWIYYVLRQVNVIINNKIRKKEKSILRI
jgi:uncharacterized BrkB/YihY/UPF0761 family membrane protein